MKICSKCKEVKNEVEFSFKNKDLNVRHRQCKVCTRILVKGHYSQNKEYYLKKAHTRNLKMKNEVTEYLIAYLKDHPCIDCGEKDLRVLEFDHRKKVSKFLAVGTLVGNRYPVKVVKEEVKKCDVRCANCHRRKTAVDFSWFKHNARL